MTVGPLPSGRWRARVWFQGRDVPTSRLLLTQPTSYETRDEALAAEAEARRLVRSREITELPVFPSQKTWHLASKGEPSCRACGGPAVHLHHIIPRRLFPEGGDNWVENGVPLCAKCHVGWHHRVLEIPHQVLTDPEFLYVCDAVGAAWVDRHYFDPYLGAGTRLILLRRARNDDDGEVALAANPRHGGAA